jgi:IS1 family transposase/transposase-like protein
MIIKETETEIIVYKCHQCGSTNLVKNGKNRLGQAQYRCNDCRTHRVLEPRRKNKEADKTKALKACLERCSLRGVARIFQIGRDTLTDWIQEHFEQLPSLPETLLPSKPDDTLELDEAWSFVAKKADKRWIWTAMCRRTRQIVACVIGDRSEDTCQKLWDAIPKNYRQAYCYSDFWQAYQNVIPAEQHSAVGKETGETAHMERWYNTLRQWVGRMTRKTLSFSKKDEWHDLFIRWFIIEHNLRMATSLT